MPRLELELSPDLPELPDLPEILAQLTATFADCPTVDPASIKTYANVHPHAVTGPGATPGFIHLTVCILTGRDLPTRQSISKTLADRLEELFPISRTTQQAGLTVEIREMDRESFTKR